MINLFEHYNQASWDLHYSLIVSGYNNPTIAVNDNGFLPEDVTSPYQYFTGFDKAQGQPLYFNAIEVPEFWEITGNNSHGEIFEFDQKRAHIHYAEPKHKRLVQSVDWYDHNGRVRVIDRYNQFGYRYAQTNVNLQGQETFTTYFNQDNQEVITENHTTGDIILNSQGKVHLFQNRAEFVTFYLKTAGYELDRIFYNSLSTPFLVAYSLDRPGQDVLFWQEPIAESLPGNMTLLYEATRRQTKVVVQQQVVYDKMQALMTPKQTSKTDLLGFLYPFKRPNTNRKEILILTNSDQLEGIEELVSQQMAYHFHIGAITEMSSKLMNMGRYRNVSLYPNISQQQVGRLFATCDYYLDINQGNEILSAIRAAFENNMLILAFENTRHNPLYTAAENTFASGDVAGMNRVLKALADKPELLTDLLAKQTKAANVETTERYQEVIR